MHFSPHVKLFFLGGGGGGGKKKKTKNFVIEKRVLCVGGGGGGGGLTKRKPKIFGFENVMERGIRKTVTFEKLHMASKIVRKIILKPS